MIKHVSFRDFKALRSVALDLERLTVIVGPNGSGKTSILDGMYYACQAIQTDPQELFCGHHAPHWIERRGTTSGFGISLHSTDGLQFQIEARRDESSEWEFLTTFDTRRPVELSFAVFLHLDARKPASASYSEHVRPRIEHDGKGLASVLAHMALNQPDDFALLQERLR